jgi:HEPN pEK499 p136
MAQPAEILDTATVERNDALTFASLTVDNLRFVEAIYEQDRTRHATSQVHLVTHIVNSLLGLVVFTCEKNFVRHTLNEKINDLVSDGWPAWKFTLGGSPGDTLGELAYHLRNGAAHARLKYSSDDPNPSKVTITFEDADPKTKTVYWRACISGADLLKFCYRYGEHLDDVIG